MEKQNLGDQNLKKNRASKDQQKTIDIVKANFSYNNFDIDNLPSGSVKKESGNSQYNSSKDLSHSKENRDSIQDDINSIRETEVYNHLPGKMRKTFEKQLSAFENVYKDFFSDDHYEEAIQVLKTLSEIKKKVEFEQKVYVLTGLTSERFSAKEFSAKALGKQDHQNIRKRIADAATSFGWKGVMERVTEVIQQQPENWNCVTIYNLSVNLSRLPNNLSPILSLQSKQLCHIKCRCIIRSHFSVRETVQMSFFSA